MKVLVSLLLPVAVCGQTSGFWQSKPFPDWTTKQIQKLETDSPWSKQLWASDGVPSSTVGSTIRVTVSWQSALPLRQALARERFANQATTSAEAKQLIEEEPQFYQILVTVVPRFAIVAHGRGSVILVRDAALSVNGKVPFPAVNVEIGGDEDKAVMLFLFPRNNPISLNDKEVDFSTKLGSFQVWQRFRLKDMVFQGRLEL